MKSALAADLKGRSGVVIGHLSCMTRIRQVIDNALPRADPIFMPHAALWIAQQRQLIAIGGALKPPENVVHTCSGQSLDDISSSSQAAPTLFLVYLFGAKRKRIAPQKEKES
ncbi:unnamed protein product [Clonostachys byssicola]|uniref:Uncharacterized protein n=1 Tax=Clonostachys byssicola TaxID=160290 RepID=A0A9N9YCL1_9HYPO|nr:unnamed protein product [Clonostachys byssicola]